MDEGKKSIDYTSHGTLKSTAKFEEAQESEGLPSSEKVDVSKVVQRFPTTTNSVLAHGFAE